MQLEEATDLCKYLGKVLKIKIVHVSDIKNSDDISNTIFLELKHKDKNNLSNGFQREIYYIYFFDNIQEIKNNLYSNIISYMLRYKKDYYDLRLSMIELNSIENDINTILANVNYNADKTIPVRLNFIFNDFFHRSIMILTDDDGIEDIKETIAHSKFLKNDIKVELIKIPY